MKSKILVVAGLSLAILAGCGKSDIETAWNGSKSDPLLDSNPSQDPSNPGTPGDPILRTAYCVPDANGPYGDHIRYSDLVQGSHGHDGAANFDWGQAGGCVNRSFDETWLALQNHNQLIFKDVTSTTFTTMETPEGFAHYYQAKYMVKNSFPLPSVDFTVDWFHSLRNGTFEQPKQVVIRYKKVRGTKYIGYWEGSITLDYIRPGVTSVTVRNQINATRQNDQDAENTARDLVSFARNLPPAQIGANGEVISEE